MASPDISLLFTDVRKVLAGVWPEVLPANNGGGIWEAEHIDRVAWVDLPLPYAVLLVEGATEWDEGPLSALWYQVPMSLFYVMNIAGSDAPIRTKLKLASDAFWPTDPIVSAPYSQTAQRWKMGAPMWGDSLRPNVIFSAAGHGARCGMVPITFLCGS